MLGYREDRPEKSRGTNRRRSHPQIEGLEDRLLLFAPNGGEWVFPERITFSFAPDGTDVGGSPSTLNAAMAAQGISTSSWHNQFRKAFAAWQSAANLNFSEVTDDGTMLSDSGNQQNDPRFGDIRIAGYDLGSGVLGMAFLPPALNGGTLAGDILLNTSASWNVNSDYDVLTVAIHEIGHAIGLGHSTVSSSVMSYVYNGVQQSLKTDDVNGIQSIYDARPADALEGPLGNNTYLRAANLNSQIDAQNQIRLGELNIRAANDQDWYYVNVPAGASTQMTVSMQSTNLSLLAPRLQVYSSALQGLVDVAGTPYGSTVTATINGVNPGSGFYIRAITSTGGPSSGSYGLLVNFSTQPIDPINPPDTTVPEGESSGGSSNLDNHGNGGKDKDNDKGKGKDKQKDKKDKGKGGDSTQVEQFVIGHLVGHGDILSIDGDHGHDHGPTQTMTLTTNPPAHQGFLLLPDPSASELPGQGSNARNHRQRRLPPAAVDAFMARFGRN